MRNFIQIMINFFKALLGKKEEFKPITSNSGTVHTGTTVPNPTSSTNTNNVSNKHYNGKIIILDNGHASSTVGKKSPFFSDGKTRFYEYEFNRDIVKRIVKKLDILGIKYFVIVPEINKDIALSVRANRVNKLCNQYGTGNCVLISVHANASGNGSEWMKARGWSVYTTKGVTKSDAIATTFWEEANKLLPKYNMTMRKDMQDGDPDYEENFTIIYKALCPAILTENLFYDNKIDVDFLMSETGRNIIADIHINAIKKVCGL